MKKILTTLLLVSAILLTVSSCKPEEKEAVCTMCGTYNGNIVTNDTLRIHVTDLLDNDTMFSTLASVAKISESSSKDSLDVVVSLTLAGVDVDLDVTGYKTSDSKITITNYIYNYANILDILVNGEVTINGSDAVADVKLANAPDAPNGVLVEGDLTFTGSK